MSFEWTDYLGLARQLYQEGTIHSSKEAELRSAISRAYYAAFCKARNYLQGKGTIFQEDTDIHWAVREKFKNSANMTYREIGENLNRLRRYRNDADYKDRLPGASNVAKYSLELADDIISDLRSL